MVQAMHSLADFIISHPQETKQWNITSNSLVCLSTKDLTSLEEFCQRLSKKNIKFTPFYEPDIQNQLTSICLEPTIEARKATSSFPLALKEFHALGITKHSELI